MAGEYGGGGGGRGWGKNAKSQATWGKMCRCVWSTFSSPSHPESATPFHLHAMHHCHCLSLSLSLSISHAIACLTIFSHGDTNVHGKAGVCKGGLLAGKAGRGR